MKTRKILAASTAALLSFASVAVVASAVDIVDLDEDGVDIGDGVKASLTDKEIAKFKEDFNITATEEDVDEGDTDKDGNKLVADDSDVVKDLNKTLKKEISKIKVDEFAIYNITLADGDFVEDSAPVAIKFTVNVGFDAKVYHVNGDSVEKLKATSRKRTDGTYDVTFSTKSFSPFIFTTADLKSSGSSATTSTATNDADSTPADSSAPAANAADSNTNPPTGIEFAIAPVVLAAGAVAVVALKKKH